MENAVWGEKKDQKGSVYSLRVQGAVRENVDWVG